MNRLCFTALSLAITLHCLEAAGQAVAPQLPRIGWIASGGSRMHRVEPAAGRPAGFALLGGGETGVVFTNRLSEAAVARNRVTENGSGVALGDVDGDGWCDIYLCGLEGSNALYRNLGGLRFEEITAAAGVACDNQLSTGALMADVDGDHDLDLLVNSLGGGTRLFINDGKARFTERTDTRLTRRFAATSMAMGDIDRDGDLDLYVANYRTISFRDEIPPVKVEARLVDGQINLSPAGRFVPLTARQGQVEMSELGERDFIYLNQGGGSFAPISWTSGSFVDRDGKPLKVPPQDWGLAVAFRDLNQDGWPDLYVCNDFFFSPDRIWFNRGGAGFREATLTEFSQISMSSMAVDFADINRDGFDDIFVAEMLGRELPGRQRRRDNVKKTILARELGAKLERWESPRNTLHLNRGDSTYAEIAQYAGLDATEWSWGAIFCDVDLDGLEDLIIPTGNNHDVQDADALRAISRVRAADTLEQRMENLRSMPQWRTPILAYRNKGDLTFEDRGVEWGFTLAGVTHGAALADLDNDGDLDLVANSLNGPALVYRNESTATRVAVRLKGRPPNTRGIGAVLKLTGGGMVQRQEMMAGGRYLSSDEPIRVFAALGEGAARTLEVVWPDGLVSKLNGVAANTVYEISQVTATAPDPIRPAHGQPLFAHAEAPAAKQGIADHAELEAQPTLPHSMGPRGQRIAVLDLDADGVDDLVFTADRGEPMACFLGSPVGAWKPTSPSWAAAVAQRDQTAILPIQLEAGRAGLAIALAPQGRSGSSAVAIVDLKLGKLVTRVETGPGVIGSLHAADVDGDGDLDLFAAARFVAGRWPVAPPSHLLINSGGNLALDKEQPALASLGMAAAARFVDLDGDGLPELVAAIDCGPIRALKNNKGKFETHAENFGINSGVGFWSALEVGDFNGDGRPDFAVGNLGRNTRHHGGSDFPHSVHYADVDGDGVIEVVEAARVRGGDREHPWLDFDVLSKHLPWLEVAFPTYRAYGEASAREVWGDMWPNAQTVAISTHDSMLLLSSSQGYETRSLPVQAQFAPARCLLVADFNQDGRDDLLIGQNLMATRPDISPHDAGRGLILLGQRSGELLPVEDPMAGLGMTGEQVSMAYFEGVSDSAGTLVVAQNFGPVVGRKLSPGARGPLVRFEGGPGNPGAIGARWRPIEAGASTRWEATGGVVHRGRWRELRPGARVECVWPDGSRMEFTLPNSGRHVFSQIRGLEKMD